MNYYLGIDIGTTSSKAVAFSEKGTVLSSVAVEYGMQHPLPNQSEQNPDEIFEAVVTGIKQIVEAMLPHTPVFIAFSAAMHSLVAIGKQGELLTQCIIWADNRADALAEKLKHSEQGKYCYQESGVPVHSMSPLCKLLWLKENNTEVFEKADKFIGIKEYVFYKLFGIYVVDTSIASATGLLQTKTLRWDNDILNLAGITADRLSTIVSTKAIFHYNNQNASLQFVTSIPFVIGASDGALANLGTNAVDDVLAVTIGTSGAARLIVNTPVTDSRMRTFCYHLKDDLYIAGGANNNGAIVLQWLNESILQSGDTYEALFEQAARIDAGSNGLIFLPYILGERAPLWNANAKGVYFGLTINHTKAHMIRATIEAVVFSMFSIAKILLARQPVAAIHASGGFAKSDLWLQIVADIFNVKVLVSGAYEAAALGAVMLGTEAMHLENGIENKLLASYIPNYENHRAYQISFQKFERLYELLQYEMVSDSIVKTTF